MGHGVWHPSGRPNLTTAPKPSLGGDDSRSLVVRGDMVTVLKNNKRVRIFVEYVGHGVVEGTVTRTAGGFKKGAWISSPLRAAVGIKEYEARITQCQLD